MSHPQGGGCHDTAPITDQIRRLDYLRCPFARRAYVGRRWGHTRLAHQCWRSSPLGARWFFTEKDRTNGGSKLFRRNFAPALTIIVSLHRVDCPQFHGMTFKLDTHGRSIAFPCYKAVPIVWKNITNATQSDGGRLDMEEKRTPLSTCSLWTAERSERRRGTWSIRPRSRRTVLTINTADDCEGVYAKKAQFWPIWMLYPRSNPVGSQGPPVRAACCRRNRVSMVGNSANSVPGFS